LTLPLIDKSAEITHELFGLNVLGPGDFLKKRLIEAIFHQKIWKKGANKKKSRCPGGIINANDANRQIETKQNK